MNETQARKYEVRKNNMDDLKGYAKKNPVKFAQKFGDLDFNNLPEGFENMVPLYKLLVARKRSQAQVTGIPIMEPITPWNTLPQLIAQKAKEAEQAKIKEASETTGQA